MGAVTSKISEPRLRGIAVPSPRANPQSARPLGKLSMHRRRRHGHVRIFGLGLQNEPIGPQLRFLPGCQKPAADPALRAARASFHRDRLGDFIGCEAGRAGDVGYFHRSNMIGFLPTGSPYAINATPRRPVGKFCFVSMHGAALCSQTRTARQVLTRTCRHSRTPAWPVPRAHR